MTGRFLVSAGISWFFTLVFLTLGVMNLILVHPVPGIFYLLFSCIFLPPLTTFLKSRTGVSIPLWIKILLALIILWGTLAVGDLAEMYGL
ncbi:MAG TPA: hypothetical protein ENO10_05290 [Salinimicrobium catena]|uniref:AI-2E family transporter n=1 Tax=Salinimicrobium catena TaxID=390640 RepID=A0A7C2RQF8_9FLAO|nr:hypothetical protein [Salinimicrobium catena]